MPSGFKKWKQNRILKRKKIERDLWEMVRSDLPILDKMEADKAIKLRRFATLFSYEKKFKGLNSFEIDDFTRIYIACLACLPVLNLGLSQLDLIKKIFIYENRLKNHKKIKDLTELVDGEKKGFGFFKKNYLIFYWDELRASGQGSGFNTVIHKIAHILDLKNNEKANGFPPLPESMNVELWKASFLKAWQEARRWTREDEKLILNPSARRSPAEFFAICCEYFFESPYTLKKVWPDIFEQLELFFENIDFKA